MIQHNGFYSCTYCLCSGKRNVTVSGGNIVVFPLYEDRSFRRRPESTYKSAITSIEKGCNCLIKSNRDFSFEIHAVLLFVL